MVNLQPDLGQMLDAELQVGDEAVPMERDNDEDQSSDDNNNSTISISRMTAHW